MSIILLLGENRDYYGAKTSREELEPIVKTILQKTYGPYLGPNLLEAIKDKSLVIPAYELEGFGGSFPMQNPPDAPPNPIERVYEFFKSLSLEGDKHKADCILLNSLEIKQKFREYNMFGFVQMLNRAAQYKQRS